MEAIEFIEWVVEMFPPEYDLDKRRRFLPQIKSPSDNELLWIETHKFDKYNPIFYTTKEVYDLWLLSKKII